MLVLSHAPLQDAWLQDIINWTVVVVTTAILQVVAAAVAVKVKTKQQKITKGHWTDQDALPEIEQVQFGR